MWEQSDACRGCGCCIRPMCEVLRAVLTMAHRDVFSPLSTPAGLGFALRAVVCQGHCERVNTALVYLLIRSQDD